MYGPWETRPFRQQYLDLSLAYIANRTDVWLTTTDEIARHFKTSVERSGPLADHRNRGT